MDDYTELSSESSLEIESSDEDEGCMQLVEVDNNNTKKIAEARVLSSQQVYRMMESELKKVCDVTSVSLPQSPSH